MYARQITNEEVCNLKIADEICKNEERENKTEQLYYLRQKVYGLLTCFVGIVVPMITEGDITVSILTIPIGLYLIFTREKVMK
jgi:hypothetical protein